MEKILIEALEAIESGTEDTLPPFRNMPASSMSEIAKKALQNYYSAKEIIISDGVVECWYCHKKYGKNHPCGICGREGR